MFDQIFSTSYKNLFNQAIDTLISGNGLGTLCKLNYQKPINSTNDCDNCIIDPIYKQSMGKYNGIGPRPFQDGSVCPVCNGIGYTMPNTSENVYMAVIVSEKDWIDIGLDKTKIPNGSVQTISKAETAAKIKNTYSMNISNENGTDNNLLYERYSDPQYVGFGSHDYIITIWKKIL